MQRRMTARSVVILGAACLGLVSLGCGKSDQFSTVPVKGTVEFDGKPMVGGGSIAFMPLANQEGKMAGGEIKEDGSFVMSTYQQGDGSIPGEFRVVITQTTVQEPDFATDGSESSVGEVVVTVSDAERIPAIYSDQFNSPLTAKVDSSGTTDLTLNLEKQ